MIWLHFGSEAEALTDLIIFNHAVTFIFTFKQNNKLQEATAMSDRIMFLTGHHIQKIQQQLMY